MSDNKWLPVVGESCVVYYKNHTLYISNMIVTYVGVNFLVGTVLTNMSEISLTKGDWYFCPIPDSSEVAKQKEIGKVSSEGIGHWKTDELNKAKADGATHYTVSRGEYYPLKWVGKFQLQNGDNRKVWYDASNSWLSNPIYSIEQALEINNLRG